MPLPIEVIHVLGRKSLTLAYRDVDAPVTVGRSKECDVQIPSVTVGATHCMLFVHEGQWLLQETPDSVVTVNGQPIAGPVALQIGDVIGIGSGAKVPTIQIDPAGAASGKTGPVVETAPAPGSGGTSSPAVIGSAGSRTVRPPKPKPVAGEAPPQLSQLPEPERASDEYSPAGEPAVEEYAAAAVGGLGDPHSDAIDLGQSSPSAQSPYRRRPPKPKQDSGTGGMIALFIVVVGVLGILIFAAWYWEQGQNEAIKPVVVTPSPVGPGNGDGTVGPGNSIFDVPGNKPRPPATPPAGVVAPPVAPPDPGSTTAPATDPADVAEDDNESGWIDVLTAHSSPDQANAIIKYDGYRQLNPGKHAAQLAQYEADAVEQLWWQRVRDLFNHRAELEKQMAEKRTDITDQPPGDFHNQLVAELAELQKKRDDADQKLTGDFAYTLPTPPDIDDRAAISELDAKRDAGKFATWKKSTLVWIREHTGRTPWSDE